MENTILYIIAAGGLCLHILFKLAEYPGSLLSGWTKKDTLVTIASAIAVPLLMVMLQDPMLSDIMPLNKVTAFLVGYQTQSFLRALAGIAGKKYFKNESHTNEENNTGTNMS